MTEPVSLLDRLTEQVSQRLNRGGGGGTSDGMDARVTRLEERADLAGERLGRIETKIDGLATRNDVVGALVAGLALGLALIGAIIGGLGWLETRAGRITQSSPAAAAQPIVIQVPASVVPPAPSDVRSRGR